MSTEDAVQVAAEPEAPATPQQKFRVDALATGREGAVKLMIITTVEPDASKLEQYRARVSAQYRQEFDAWCDPPPRVAVKPQ